MFICEAIAGCHLLITNFFNIIILLHSSMNWSYHSIIFQKYIKLLYKVKVLLGYVPN